ncbi:phosphate ABC transporter substrate-binding protein, PhoT family [Alteribacillus iranensis]|uniref:Phosphate-binding protein n=2 Tax=Alteribacillus iranensis TaxID=930128 RepID=A0A1I2CSU4_9BACI|nr:PstS family phosphate ABC transporter substrate-binding protein [Alteribacillus iranensis]SFE71314.1 phosphate ABC transporter substrate-binding protein, PhoT family [Alteribacillus iranensis]
MKKVWMMSALAAVMTVTAACGGGETETEEQSAETQAEESATTDEGSSDEEGTLSGEIAIDGSSTVFPIMEAVSEEYTKENPDVQAPVGVSGSGGGFEKFIAGETDLSNASRPMKEEEAAALEENGIEYIELPLAYDGLSVVVSQENDFIDSLTVDELKKIWVEGEAETWSDVRSEWPDEPIERFSPGTDSGTFDYFSEVILEEEDISKNAQLSEDDNVLVNGVIGSPNAIGYFGYAYYAENQDSLKAVPIDNGDGAVAPSEDTINDGTYEPLSRPIFTYVKVDSLKEDHVRDYVEFANDIAGEMALEVGYVNMPEEEYEKNQQKIEEAAGSAE